MRRIAIPALALLSSAGVLLPRAHAQDWPQWRGPRFDGSSEVKGLPAELGPEKGVRWSALLPGPSAATPIVVGDLVFLTAADDAEGKLLALALDRESGEERWVLPSPTGFRPEGGISATRRDRRSTYACPSPVADAERAIFFFGNGDLFACDREGELLWSRNLQQEHGEFQFQWTFGASPMLHGGTLYLPVLQRDEPVHGRGEAGRASFLLAIDPANGETLFKHVRPAPARRESLEAYTTPIPYRAPDGSVQILVAGGDVLTAHAPKDGAELWRWGTWNPDHREEWWRVVPSPVVGAGRILVCGPKGAPVFALGEPRAGEEGAPTSVEVAWKSEGRRNPVSTDVPTPLFYEGAFFVLGDLTGTLSRVDAATGAVVWTVSLPAKDIWRASPTGADGRIWCINHTGLLAVLSPADGKLLFQTTFADEPESSDEVAASVTPAHGALFVRTNTRLWCLGS